MLVTGWSNGNANNSTGRGYGIRVNKADRSAYFCQGWGSVTVTINGNAVNVNISQCFWTTRLRSQEIGIYMINAGLAPWATGPPPTLELTPEDGPVFTLGLAIA